MNQTELYTGCLLGGAVGDALGRPIEFLSIDAIRQKYGPQGVSGFEELNRAGEAEFTDDTQMTLFTAEGLINAHRKDGSIDVHGAARELHAAYLRWYQTQTTGEFPGAGRAGESRLLAEKGLWKRQGPGSTCLSALGSGQAGSIDHPINHSKGCGGVMRAAPVGLVLAGAEAFRIGAVSAAITHGHPSGYLSSGVLAHMIAGLRAGQSIREALDGAVAELKNWRDHEETLKAIDGALEILNCHRCIPSPETIERMGGAWVGEEALAISLYCALIGEQEGSFARGVLLAANHTGDCDSTAAIAGNLLGARMGVRAIPAGWLAKIELRGLIESVAGELQAVAQS